MTRVFISYSDEDREFARWIRGALTQAGIVTNSDDLELSPGSDFSSSIRNAIQTADALVVILSDRAISSRHTGLEIGMAAGLGKKEVAVLAPGTKPDIALLRSIADAGMKLTQAPVTVPESVGAGETSACRSAVNWRLMRCSAVGPKPRSSRAMLSMRTGPLDEAIVSLPVVSMSRR